MPLDLYCWRSGQRLKLIYQFKSNKHDNKMKNQTTSDKNILIHRRHHIVIHDSLNYFQNIHGLRCYKIKSGKCKRYKRMLIIRTCSLIFEHYTWSNFEDRLSYSKVLICQPHKGRNSSQIHTCIFPSYPSRTPNYQLTSM
jgi:hypothetical protein